MTLKTGKLLYWLSPILGVSIQLVIYLMAGFSSAAQEPDSSFALFASLILILVADLVILILSYSALWAIMRFKQQFKLLIGALLIVYLAIWIFIGIAAGCYNMGIFQIGIYCSWVALYIVPIIVAIKNVLKKSFVTQYS